MLWRTQTWTGRQTCPWALHRCGPAAHPCLRLESSKTTLPCIRSTAGKPHSEYQKSVGEPQHRPQHCNLEVHIVAHALTGAFTPAAQKFCMQDAEVNITLDAFGNTNATTETEEARELRLRARNAQRKLRRLEHRFSATFHLAQGLLLDCACDSDAVQAAVASLAPRELCTALRERQASSQAADRIVLQRACAWVHQTFSVDAQSAEAEVEATDADVAEGGRFWEAAGDHASASTGSTGGQREWLEGCSEVVRGVEARLLRACALKGGGELHVAAMLTALLRACGWLARHVVNLQVRCQHALAHATAGVA